MPEEAAPEIDPEHPRHDVHKIGVVFKEGEDVLNFYRACATGEWPTDFAPDPEKAASIAADIKVVDRLSAGFLTLAGYIPPHGKLDSEG